MRRIVPALVLASAALAIAPGDAAADRLVGARRVVSGAYLAPRFAPDGRALLLTGPHQRGLYLASLDGTIRKLDDGPAAGVHARFAPDGTIVFRAERAGGRRDLVIGADGRARSAAPAASIALARDGRIYVADGGRFAEIATGDRFFAPQLSPDRDKVAFQGLATGIYIHVRSTGELIHVGPGTAPAWSPDSSRLVYELTEDDGHEIVAADLHLYDLAGRRHHRLTATDAEIERRPSFSPGGREIAFDDDRGQIWIARLEATP